MNTTWKDANICSMPKKIEQTEIELIPITFKVAKGQDVLLDILASRLQLNRSELLRQISEEVIDLYFTDEQQRELLSPPAPRGGRGGILGREVGSKRAAS